MAHNTRIRTVGVWVTPALSDLLPAEMLAFDAAQAASIGEGGGVYDVTNSLVISGANGTSISAPTTIDSCGLWDQNDAVTVQDGGEFQVFSDSSSAQSTMTVAHALDVRSGGAVTLQTGATLETQGTVSFAGTINVTAPRTLLDGSHHFDGALTVNQRTDILGDLTVDSGATVSIASNVGVIGNAANYTTAMTIDGDVTMNGDSKLSTKGTWKQYGVSTKTGSSAYTAWRYSDKSTTAKEATIDPTADLIVFPSYNYAGGTAHIFLGSDGANDTQVIEIYYGHDAFVNFGTNDTTGYGDGWTRLLYHSGGWHPIAWSDDPYVHFGVT